jgi:hypothetical protein
MRAASNGLYGKSVYLEHIGKLKIAYINTELTDDVSRRPLIEFSVGLKARDQVNFVDVDGNDILQRRC